MKEFLFLGSSHVASLKVAYDLLADKAPFRAQFFAARGADLAFTDVQGRQIVPAARSTLSDEAYSFFFAEGQACRDRYLSQAQPLADVRMQFLNSGKAEAADFGAVSAIFYAVGTSPYDFVRLQEGAAHLSSTLRALVMDRLVGTKCVLRPQIEGIRRAFPQIKHVYIGAPLQFMPLRPLTAVEQDIVVAKRSHINAMARDCLFDEVFMPTEDLLESSLLATKQEFFQNGRQEAERFQHVPSTESDFHHVNGHYGLKVIEKIVLKYAA